MFSFNLFINSITKGLQLTFLIAAPHVKASIDTESKIVGKKVLLTKEMLGRSVPLPSNFKLSPLTPIAGTNIKPKARIDPALKIVGNITKEVLGRSVPFNSKLSPITPAAGTNNKPSGKFELLDLFAHNLTYKFPFEDLQNTLTNHSDEAAYGTVKIAAQESDFNRRCESKPTGSSGIKRKFNHDESSRSLRKYPLRINLFRSVQTEW